MNKKTLALTMDKNTNRTLKAELSTLEGMGILPDGRVIIGNLNSDPEYFYNLMKLKEEYHNIQNNKRINGSRKEKLLGEIYNKAYSTIQMKYPDLLKNEVKKRTDENWLNVPSGYYTIHDVTDRLNDFMKSYVDSPDWKLMRSTDSLEELLGTLGMFYFEVKKGGPLDLKTNPEWQNSLFMYNGEIVDRDALANIAFGYFGIFLEISESMLNTGAAIAQFLDEGSLTGDDPRDAVRVKQGIDLYNLKIKKS